MINLVPIKKERKLTSRGQTVRTQSGSYQNVTLIKGMFTKKKKEI